MKKSILLTAVLATALSACESNQVTSVKSDSHEVTIETTTGTYNIRPISDNALRVRFGTSQQQSLPEWIYLESDKGVSFCVNEDRHSINIELERISAQIKKADGSVSYFDANGKLILREDARSVVPDSIQGRPTFNVSETFASPDDEHLYGLGQFQDGYLDIKGLSRRLTQVNTQISIPFILSSKGYGLLWNNYGLTNFNPSDNSIALLKKNAEGEKVEVDVTSTEGNRREMRENNIFEASLNIDKPGKYALLLDVGQQMARRHNLQIDGQTVMEMRNLWLPPTASAIVELGKGTHAVTAELTGNDKPVLYYKPVTATSTFNSPVADGIDYTVFAGSADEVIGAYRDATGNAPLMPRWALGYIHCRERFHSQDEIISNANEFRKRGIPMDVMVQDWQYWGKYGWNAMRFDEDFYPNPKKLVDDLHSIGARLMISVWSKIDENSEVGKMATERGFYIKNTSWIDFFNPDATKFYWENFSDKLLKPYGIDAWWQDATEPENDDLVGRMVNDNSIPGEMVRNIYPNMVNKTVYEGLCNDDPDRRPLILTRSGFAGIHRYGSALWSGDVGNDWETLRRQIVGGLGLMASGHPWWTYDAGGFFRPFDQHRNADYQECLLRWIQTATFLPMMRVHGYMSDTEIWRYGEETERIATNAINLRYKLLPYIYSLASNISSQGGTIMRPLVMDFADDAEALSQQTEYMFGPALLVCPVTEPKITSTNVYLPKTEGGWFNLYTHEKFDGGASIETPVSIENIPVFAKAGSIIPQGKAIQSTDYYDASELDIIIFPNADAKFLLYEDEGDNNNYMKGERSEIEFTWNDSAKALTIGKREGQFKGMLSNRIFNIIFADGKVQKRVEYNGEEQTINFNQ